uniref:Uncharacterized protein n=1 Tax=Parascaris univalens TaxID=6257 RepID=A0A915A5K9_PARUN
MLIESYASKIGETRREDERLFQELTGLGIETSRSAMEKEVNEVRIKIDSLKEELAMLDASLGDERQKSVSEVKGELLKLKEAKAERTQELAEIRRLIAECKDKLLVVLKNGSYAYHPADGATLPAPGTVRLPSSVQNVDTAKGAEVSTKPKAELSSPRKEKSKVASVSDNGLLSPGPVKATTSQPMMANWHAEKSVGKLLRSDNAQESSPMSSKSVGAGDLH